MSSDDSVYDFFQIVLEFVQVVQTHYIVGVTIDIYGLFNGIVITLLLENLVAFL